MIYSPVPFSNVGQQNEGLRAEIDREISTIIENSSFIRGPQIDRFEESYAKLFNIRNCVSCGNGTDALFIALKSLNVGYGDEVIVPAQSWISTSETVTLCGAKVVFCDIEEDTFCIDATKISGLINKNTVGIIPVHLYGQPADMKTIMEIANKYKLWVIEDCAQAHLATFDDQLIGTFGVAGTFSFYPGKNLGAIGDAGAIITNDDNLADKMTMFARHGGINKGEHNIEGINSRMDSIQAAVLSIKLRYLESWTEIRRMLARDLNKNFSGLQWMEAPKIRQNCNHAWHLYVIKTEYRDRLRSYLAEKEISTAINYPIILPLLQAYQYLNHTPDDFPKASKLQHEILSLPCYPEMTNDQFCALTNAVSNFSP